MIKVAVMGGIGSGKSFIAKLFKYPVFNADEEVKLIYKKDRIEVIFTEKFLPRRGRINCSMQDKDGWRWFGTQFTLN